MARFTLSLPDELNDWLSSEAKQRNDSKTHLIYSILDNYRNGSEFIICGKYRMMILRLLDNGHKTNIPQEIRDAAYDLLNEAFENE